MKTNINHKLFWILAPLTIGLVVPSAIIFWLEILVGKIGPFKAVGDVLHQQFSEGNNLFLLAAFGLIPFAVLSVTCLVALRRMAASRVAWIGTCGLVGILCLMIPAHVSVWYPLYSGKHTYSTAVVAFVFIPFYCLAPLCVGMIAGWQVSRLPFVSRRENRVDGGSQRR